MNDFEQKTLIKAITAGVTLLVISALAIMAIFFIPVRLFPQSDQATITVSTFYPGATSEISFGSIQTPLNRYLSKVPDLDYIIATSEDFSTTHQLILRPNANVQRALSEALARVQESRAELPFGAFPPKVEVQKQDSKVADMYISFRSGTLPIHQVADWVERVAIPDLSQIEGVQNVILIGSTKPAIKLKISPVTLQRSDLSPSTFEQAVRSFSQPYPVGYLDVADYRLFFDLSTLAKSFGGLAFKQFKLRDSAATVGDISDVIVEAENFDIQARFNSQPAVFAGVFVSPFENTLSVLRKVKSRLESFKEAKKFLGEITVPYDASVFIEASIKEILKTLLETLIIVGVIVFLCLQDVKSFVVAFISLISSILIIAPFLFIFGYSINLLTILALVLSVGIMIDDMILVIERFFASSEDSSSFNASIYSLLTSLWKPMTVLNLALIILFLPFLFQEGLTADLFKEFALTIILAMLTSLLCSLTVVPTLLIFLHKQGFKFRNNPWKQTEQLYGNFLRKALSHSKVIVLSYLGLLAFLPVFSNLSSKDFLPKEDRSVILTVVETPTFLSPNRVSQILDEWYDTLKNVPAVRHVFQLGGVNFSFGGVGLLPYSERDLSAFEIERELYKASRNFKSGNLLPVNPPPVPSAGTFPVEIALLSPFLNLGLLDVCDQVANYLKQTRSFAFVDCVPKSDKLNVTLKVNEKKLADHGIDINFFQKELAFFTINNFVSIFPQQGSNYRVYLKLQEGSLQDFEHIPFRWQDRQYFIGSFIDYELSPNLAAYQSVKQQFAVILRGAPFPGTPLGDAVQHALDIVKSNMPPEFSFEALGDSRNYIKNVQESKILYAFALALIFLLFVAYTQSFTLASITLVLSSLSSFFIGNLVCFVLGFSVNFYSSIGMLMLTGLVSKNYIIFLANLLNQRAANDYTEECVKTAIDRLRPITMTTISTIAGHIPLVLATGAGAVARNSIGVVLVCGMVFLYLVSLFVYPCFVKLALQFKNWKMR